MSSPTPWADRLFARFSALYGAPKLASNWPADRAGEVRQAWEEQLRRFSANTLRRALQALIDAGREWPPTLPEFVALCRDFHRLEQSAAPAALPPPTPTEVAQATETIDRIAAGMAKPPAWDHLTWARQPRSAAAVQLLVAGAQREPRLRDILAEHLRANGREVSAPDAIAAIQAYAQAHGAVA
jgi:hypothetical protein